MTQKICHDCDCKEGELHEHECDMERCPFCGRQLITCLCKERHFYPGASRDKDMCGLPEHVYKNGFSEEQNSEWYGILEKKGRIPYIYYPSVCVRCGSIKPIMFSTSDEEWERYVEPLMRSRVLCLPCYTEIKRLIDEGTKLVDEETK